MENKRSAHSCQHVVRRLSAGLTVLLLTILSSLPSFAERATYFYDATGRLVLENENGTMSNYGYDKVGNLLSLTQENYQALPPALQGITPNALVIGNEYAVTITGQNLFTTRVRVASTMGGGSETIYIAQSGTEIRASEILKGM